MEIGERRLLAVIHIREKKRKFAKNAEKLIHSSRMNARFATTNFLKRNHNFFQINHYCLGEEFIPV